MSPSLTGVLCTQCGMCCDGSLLGDVELTGREAVTLEILGLDVEADGDAGGAMVLPCLGLDGTHCSIYAHRPGACRAFECRLLKRAERGEVAVERALALIAEARQRIAGVRRRIESLGRIDGRLSLKERCAEALSQSDEARPAAAIRRKQRALEAAMTEVTRLIEKEFLGVGGRVHGPE